jgi:hypothetical protein
MKRRGRMRWKVRVRVKTTVRVRGRGKSGGTDRVNYEWGESSRRRTGER